MIRSFISSGNLNQLFLSETFHLVLLVLLSSTILFSNLGKGGLSGFDDALYAHEGKQILKTGDFWTIQLNGQANFEYPPMFIWLEALSMKILGINDFAAKFPAAFLGLLTIVLVFLTARELRQELWFQICAAWILMLTQYFLKYAMHAMTDVPFTFFFTLALYLYVKALKRPKYLVVSGLAIAGAILTRSILGLLPAGVIIAHLLVIGRYRLLWSREHLVALLISLAVPLVWYLSQSWLHGTQFLSTHFNFLATKIFSRANQQHDSSVIRGMLDYPWLLLTTYWPWLPLMIVGFVTQIRAMIWSRDSMASLLVLWVAFIIVPCSFAAAKVLRYLMPVFPAFSMLSAIPVTTWLSTVSKTKVVASVYALLSVIVLLISVFPKPLPRGEDMSEIAPIVDAHTGPTERVFIYTSGELRSDYLNQFLWYSNHFCTYVSTQDELSDLLHAGSGQIMIVDKDTYERLVQDSSVKVEILGRTEKFVCLRS